jgi:hypothetical protein
VKLPIALFVMLFPLAAHGQLLKCVGKDGSVEYATQCPSGTTELSTGIRSTKEGPSSTTSPPQGKSIADREAEFRKRQIEREESRQKDEKKTAEEQEKRAACAQAQAYLKSLQEYQRITQTDPKTGERVFLEDTDRPAELAKAQRVVDSNCK